MRTNIRQGDMLFIPVAELTLNSLTRVDSGIVAEGEATGHHHRVAEADMSVAEVYRDWHGNVFMHVSERGVSIVHEEHGPQVLEPGNYKVNRAREYDYLQQFARRVRD